MLAGTSEQVLKALLRRYCLGQVKFQHSVNITCNVEFLIDDATTTQLSVKDTVVRHDHDITTTENHSDKHCSDDRDTYNINFDIDQVMVKDEPEDIDDNVETISPHSPGRSTSDIAGATWDEENTCPICPYRCFGQQAFEQHMKSNHKQMLKNKLQVKIPQNNSNKQHHGKKTAKRNLEDFKTIVDTDFVPEAGTSQVKCFECSKVYSTKHALKRHFSKVHAQKEYLCNEPAKKNLGTKHLFQHDGSTKESIRKDKSTTSKRLREQFSKSKIKLRIVNRNSVTHPKTSTNKSKLNAQDVVDMSFVANEGTSQVKCAECGKVYSSKRALRRHFAIIHSEIEYPCDECGKKFTGKESLYHHKRGIHMGLKPYKCQEPDCDASFNFSHSLRLHRLKHSGVRPHMCTTCGKTYLTAYHLKVHVQAAHSVQKNFACSTCGKTFSYSTSLKMHEATHKRGLKVSCDKCDKTFVSDRALNFHIMSKHSDDNERVVCTKCNKTYSSQMALRTHMRRHSAAGTRFMCDLCGGRFMFKSALEIHKAIHRDEKAYTCKICNKAFKTYPTLYSHQFVHQTESPFTCSKCGKAFKTKERCKAHEKRHSGTKDFVCQICSHCFSDQGGLSKHQRTVHSSVKKFVCDICGKACSRADNLRVHMKVHSKPDYKERRKKSETAMSQNTAEKRETWSELPTVVPVTINTEYDAASSNIEIKPLNLEQSNVNSLEKSNKSTEVGVKNICSESGTFEHNLPHFANLDAPMASEHQAQPLNLHTTSMSITSGKNNNTNSSSVGSIAVPTIIHLPNIGHQQYVSLPVLPEVGQPTTSGSVTVATNVHSLQPGTLYPWTYIQGVQPQSSHTTNFFQQN